MSSQTTLYSDPADVDATPESNASWDLVQARESNIPHDEIAHLIERVEHHAVRETVSAIFSSLLNLLGDVPILEHLGQVTLADETKLALDRFRYEARALVDFIRTAAITTVEVDQLLAETLDGIAFALGHDVRRSFDSELRGQNWKSGDEFVRGRVAYVRGLLTNCLQQSIITLAQVFDPSLDGGQLFDNYQARLRESLILCRDLADLVQLVRACEKDTERYFPSLIKHVNKFRGESMQFLMYKDWQEFESLTENLLDSVPDTTAPGSPLHSFHCYLETLLGQVKLRAVLVNVFCDFFPDGDSTDPEWGEAQNRLAFELYRAELTSIVAQGSL